MICYSCENVGECTVFQKLCMLSNDFCVNNCLEYVETSKLKYRKISEHDDLMALIYDYFTNQIDMEQLNKEYSYDEIKQFIAKAMLRL